MTLQDWLNSYTADGDAQYVCSWRKRAWRTMRPVVEQFVAQRDRGIPTPVGALFAGLRAAAKRDRVGVNGKRWRQEYARLVDVLREHGELWPAPSEEERAVCMVARDLVEEERFADAIALMNQAPNAISRRCPACNMKPGSHCIDPAGLAEFMRLGEVPGYWPEAQALVDSGTVYGVHRHAMIVPHEARLFA